MTATRPEHDLLLCIARRDLNERRRTDLRHLLMAPLDWSYLVSTARTHGLIPLLYRHLNTFSDEVPPAYFSTIKRESIENRKSVLALMGRLAEMLQTFDRQQLPVLVFKGSILSEVAYRENGLRQAGDVDVLIERDSFDDAKELLESLGYQMVPTLTSSQQKAHLKFHCEIQFIRDNGFTVVDLHWSLAPKAFPFGLKTEDVFARTRETSVGGQRVRTFGIEDLILFQCMHGAKHYWSRLEWITSLSELIQREKSIDWQRLVQLARRTHGLKMLALGLNLVVKLSDAQIPAGLPQIDAMRPVADEMLATIFTDRKPEYSSALAIKKNFQIMDRKRDVFVSMLRVVFVPTLSDWQRLTLPTGLQPLYYVYRPLRLLYTYADSLLRRLFRSANPPTEITSVNAPLTGGLSE